MNTQYLRTDLRLLGEWVDKGSHVLDLGCGDGTLLAHLRDERAASGYGLEIDDDKIACCIEAGVDVVQSDVDRGLSDFEANAFDYVIMSQALQVTSRPDKLLQEMLRIGKQGIVTFPNFGHWRARLQLLWEGRMPVSVSLPNEWYDTPNIHLCTLQDFEELCFTLDIEILQRAVVDSAHQSSLGMRILPNWLGEVALYRFKKKDNHESIT
jgi:methionine biosynthesis protein MetW